MPTTVRPAAPDDADAVEHLARDMALTSTVDPTTFHRTYLGLLGTADVHLLVADVDGRVAGYLLGSARPSFYANGPVAWVEEVAVAPERRRHGVGSALMAELERRAVGRGCRLVALATTRAHRFYAALGYDDHATYFRKLLTTGTGPR